MERVNVCVYRMYDVCIYICMHACTYICTYILYVGTAGRGGLDAHTHTLIGLIELIGCWWCWTFWAWESEGFGWQGRLFPRQRRREQDFLLV